MSRLKDMRGFTLVELMITIALLAIVATIAVPNFVQFIRNNQVQAKADELKTFLQYARGQAVATRKKYEITTGTDWAKGWLLILNNDEVLKVWTVSDGLNITGPEDGIIVLASGMLKTVGFISAQ